MADNKENLGARIMKLGVRVIFVFGSNREGRHGLGAARTAAQKFGAVYGQAQGLQGNSYGIVTKELRAEYPDVTIEEVRIGVNRFLDFAREEASFVSESEPIMIFAVTPIGTGLGGFKHEEIAPLFLGAPDNVVLPNCWKNMGLFDKHKRWWETL